MHIKKTIKKFLKILFFASITVFLVWAIASKINAQIITEVEFKHSPAWVEIYNQNKNSIDISGIVVTDLDGIDSQIATDKATLESGKYAVVYWDDGIDETDAVGDNNENNIKEFYLSDTPPTMTDDQIALVLPGQILDAVCWRNDDDTWSREGTDVHNLFEADQWPDAQTLEEFKNACINITGMQSSQSLARYLMPNKQSFADTNTPLDWYISALPTKGFGSDISLPVELSNFRAVKVGNHVEVVWSTQSEVNNFGFNLYRVNVSNIIEKVNQEIIPGANNSTPHDYFFPDETLGQYYFLEMIDLNGNAEKTPLIPVEKAWLKSTTLGKIKKRSLAKLP